jgi:esterase/lipase superfamily enzyme
MATASRYLRLPSQHLGRPVHLWTYGHWGLPVIAFPTASGMAHEWQSGGAIEALEPFFASGRMKLYDELLPWVAADSGGASRVGVVGASMGAWYACNFALRNPEPVAWALCLSGRYGLDRFFPEGVPADLYYHQPLWYVPGLRGEARDRVRRHTRFTFVVGTGPHEGGCIDETLAISHAMAAAGLPHLRDVWGRDSAHHWDWWKRQLHLHLHRLLPPPPA